MKPVLRLLVLSMLLPLCLGCVPENFKFSRELGKPGNQRGEILGGTDVALSPEGELVLADAGNYRFQVLDRKDGTAKLTAGSYGTEGYAFKSMAGLGVSLNGHIAVCDFRGEKVVLFDKTGKPMVRITKDVKGPTDVAFDRGGYLYVIMRGGGAIHKYDTRGGLLEKIGGTGKAALVSPSSIAIHKDHIYVADTGSRRVIKMDMKGKVVLEISQKGEHEVLRGPSCVFIDPRDDSIYVTDLGEVPVVRFDLKGQFTSKIGDLGDGKGQYVYPRSLIVNKEGEVVVLDNSRNMLLVFQALPQ